MLPKVTVYSLQMKIDTDRWLVYLKGTEIFIINSQARKAKFLLAVFIVIFFLNFSLFVLCCPQPCLLSFVTTCIAVLQYFNEEKSFFLEITFYHVAVLRVTCSLR